MQQFSVLCWHSLELALPAVVIHLDCDFPIYRFTDFLQSEASPIPEILSIAINHSYCLFRMSTGIMPKHIKIQKILHIPIEKQHLNKQKY